MASVSLNCCGKDLSCPTGGYCAEWDDGTCDSGCDPASETEMPTPLAQGSRQLRRLTVHQMRRGALRQILGNAAAEVAQDEERLDLTLENVTVAAALAMLDR